MPLIKTDMFFSCHLIDDIGHEAVLIAFLWGKHKCTIVWPDYAIMPFYMRRPEYDVITAQGAGPCSGSSQPLFISGRDVSPAQQLLTEHVTSAPVTIR